MNDWFRYSRKKSKNLLELLQFDSANNKMDVSWHLVSSSFKGSNADQFKISSLLWIAEESADLEFSRCKPVSLL